MSTWRLATKTWSFRLTPLCWLVGVALLFTRRAWQWEVTLASTWATSLLIVLAPVGAGIAAFDAYRWAHPEVQPLLRTLPRRPGVPAQLMLAAVISLGSTWIVCEAVALTLASRGGGAFTPEYLNLVEATSVIIVAAALGIALGTTFHSVLAAPAAVIITYVASPVLSNIGSWAAFRVNGAASPLAGLIRNPTPVLIAALVNLLLAWVFISWPRRAVRGRRSTTAHTVAAAVALIAPVFIPFNRYLIDPAPAHVCSETAPRVCVLREHEGYLEPLTGKILATVDTLTRLGITPRPEYREVADPSQAVSGSAHFYLPEPEHGTPGDVVGEDSAMLVASPSACPDSVGLELADVRYDFTQALSRAAHDTAGSDPAAQRLRDLYQRLESCRP